MFRCYCCFFLILLLYLKTHGADHSPFPPLSILFLSILFLSTLSLSTLSLPTLLLLTIAEASALSRRLASRPSPLTALPPRLVASTSFSPSKQLLLPYHLPSFPSYLLSGSSSTRLKSTLQIHSDRLATTSSRRCSSFTTSCFPLLSTVLPSRLLAQPSTIRHASHTRSQLRAGVKHMSPIS